LSYLLRLFAAGATASAQVTIRSGSATAEISRPNRRLKYRSDIVSMPQRYRAAVLRASARLNTFGRSTATHKADIPSRYR
jgi:hypothetical protein